MPRKVQFEPRSGRKFLEARISNADEGAIAIRSSASDITLVGDGGHIIWRLDAIRFKEL